MLLKVDCLPNPVGKQPSIPLIYPWKKMDVKLMMMMMMMTFSVWNRIHDTTSTNHEGPSQHYSSPGDQLSQTLAVRKFSFVMPE